MPSKIMKRGKPRWLASVMKDGKRKQKLLKTKTEALKWEADQRSEEWSTTSTDSLVLLEWANKYMDFCQKYAEATIWEKKYTFKIFFSKINPHEVVSALTSGIVMEIVQKVASEKGGNVANKIRKNLVAAWNWGIKYYNLPRPNPCLVDRFPEKRKPRYVPPVDDFWKVYDVASSFDQLMLLAYLHTAARRKELFNLTWEDVDFTNQRIRLWTSKREGGSREFDWIPMTDDLNTALFEHHRTSKSTLVFPNPDTNEKFTSRQHYLKRACRRAKVVPFGWHSIRHLTASMLISNGVPLSTIQKILRHKNLTTTQRYVHELDYDRSKIQQVLTRKQKNPQLVDQPRAKLVVVK